MNTSKNRLKFDYKDNPDLKAALGGLPAGAKCSITLELTVVANDDERLESSIDGIEYDIPEGDETESGSVEPTAEEPVMAVISKRSDAKKKKPAAPPVEEVEEDE